MSFSDSMRTARMWQVVDSFRRRTRRMCDVRRVSRSRELLGRERSSAWALVGAARVARLLAWSAVGAAADVPSKPTKPTVQGQVEGRVALQSAVTSVGSGVTKWQYQVKKGNGAYGDWTDIVATNKLLIFTLAGFENGATYRFKVRVWNLTATVRHRMSLSR